MTMKQFNNFLKHFWPFLAYFLISIIFLFPILGQNGVPFKYDWVWPIFDMQSFWRSLLSESSFGIISSFGKYATALLGIFGVLKISPTLSIKIFLLLVHTFSAFGFYLLLSNRIKSRLVAFLAGILYAFSPYIFIRTIVGFTYSLIAYAALPFFVDRYFSRHPEFLPRRAVGEMGISGSQQSMTGMLKRVQHDRPYIILAFLFSLIFSQIQAGLLLLIFLIVSIPIARSWKTVFKNFLQFIFLLLSIVVINLPWIIFSLIKGNSAISASGSQATTLGYIGYLPHSFRNVLMFSDHIITRDFFYPFAHNNWVVAGYLIVYLLAVFALLARKNRKLVLTSFISSLLILPFTIGPTGKFAAIFTFFYNHLPQLAVFRETYHFQFLLAFNLIFLFAVGFSQILSWLKNRVLKIIIFAVIALSSSVIIAPYFDFNYRGYFRLQEIPESYSQLNNYLKENKDYCKKIYYPPSLGFLHFSNDNSFDALNSDNIAWEIGVPYVTESASILSVVNDTYFERNYLTSLFLEQYDDGEFASALSESNVDCLIIRDDLATKYFRTTNVWRDPDLKVKQKWENQDMLALAEGKVGIQLDKKFGGNIYIYKIQNAKIPASPAGGKNQNDNLKIQNDLVGKTATEQFSNKTIQQLPLSNWANQNDWYVNGWARGRYNFWKDLLFARLKQDFIVTNKPDSVLSGKIDYNRSCEVWVRVLDGNGGQVSISLGLTTYNLQLTTGNEKFVWKKLGDIELSGKTDVEIKNITGENAIADLVLVKKE
ncbi:MAG: hypothetical protein Athens101428_440 [Candidatus Berkelbacteria bacterium Athens1014_28]|uniref:Uncharacterized protein n=1 Tax=Candidatus Berkelbacteria bacterium Athens1014_28 TaxID=2017145 RepID=A0A554LMF6_9BACT|nr:MAG: hypothetical protein Athens101428_440 [Candidatus Berkelbacteria bacterium Athens1014_28]